MSVIVDALWLEVLRYAYVLSGVPWPAWLAGGMLAGAAVAVWPLLGRRGHGGRPPVRARLRFDSPAGRG
jgi:hypothetical protein